MSAKRKTNQPVVPFGMSNKHMKRKKPINSDLMRDITPLTENQKELFRCYKNDQNLVAYGAAAKGNTILNYAGIKNDLLKFVVDKSTHKQGKFLPSSRIPIVSEEKIIELKPEYILILPWNIKDEVIQQLSYIKKWDGKFVVAIPKIKIMK